MKSSKALDRSKSLSRPKRGAKASADPTIAFADGVVAAGLLVLLISLPLVFSMWFTTFNEPKNALARFMAFAMFAAWLVKMGRQGRIEIIKTPLDLPLIAFFLISSFSLVRATNIYEGIDALFRQLIYMMLYFVVVNNVENKGLFDKSLVVLSISGAIVAFYGILQMFGIDFLPLSAQNGPISSLGNRDFAAEFLILSIPAAIALFALSEGKATRNLHGIFAVIMFAHLTTTSARGTWIGCALSLVVISLFFSLRIAAYLLSTLTALLFYLFTRGANLPEAIYVVFYLLLLAIVSLILYFQKKRSFSNQLLRKRLVVIMAVCLAVSGFVFAYMTEIYPRLAALGKPIGGHHFGSDITAKGTSGSGEVRKHVYLTAVNTILKNPIWGVGVGNWAVVYPIYKVPELENDVRWEQTHNEYLQIASETGLIGFALFLSVLGAIAFMCWRILRKVKDEYWYTLAAVLTGGVAAILANNMFNFSFQNPASGVIFWIFVGFLGRIYYMAERLDNVFIARQPTEGRQGPSEDESRAKWKMASRVSEFSYGVISVVSILVLITISIIIARPLVADYHLKKGLVYSLSNDWGRSAKELETSILWYDYSFEPHFRLGQTYTALGRHDEAIKQYERTLDLRPNYERAHNNLGDVLVRKGKFDEALKSFQASARLFPNYAVARSNLGVVYEKLGRYDEAVVEYNAALKIEPNNPSMHKNIGVVYFYYLKDYQKAAYHWERALSLNPNDDQAQAIRANVELIKRVEEYQKLLEANPNNTALRNGLGITYESLSRTEDAAAEYEKALKIDFSDPVANRNLGYLLYRKGDRNRAAYHWNIAVRSWERALRANPSDPNLAPVRAEVERLKGEIAKLNAGR